MRAVYPKRQGWATTAGDLRMAWGQRERDTVVIPQIIRTSPAYKVNLGKRLRALLEELGEPQIFMTWSVDLNSLTFKGLFTTPRQDTRDIPLFCVAYNREWHRVLIYILSKWAPKVIGKVKDYAWVTEVQQRRAPHVHFVFWAERTVDELITQNNSGGPTKVVVSCKRLTGDPVLDELVARHQMHHHTPYYCMKVSKKCRFGVPVVVSDRTVFDQEAGKVVLERGQEDVCVNAYNPYILKICRSNMDIQLNKGSRSIDYLHKYMSKVSSLSEGVLREMLAVPEQPPRLKTSMESRYSTTTICACPKSAWIYWDSRCHISVVRSCLVYARPRPAKEC
ncbi:hypothetical protein EMPS_07784 [Entomortierella parvispora]|uniref:Helitron helicase-like domain-containing protein n=1 Tax=Entomortierella parvispora TaxID=205924 RepID=A0A9P3HES3_9FUNG|nr:hypothetical protein EMPS_07784 [Entomortierella parvispora]